MNSSQALLVLSLLVTSCGAHADDEVAPWSGPPVDFSGTWVTKTGIRTEHVGSMASPEWELDFGNVDGANNFIFPSQNPWCWIAPSTFSFNPTADGHGFDGTTKPQVATGLATQADLHARVDAAGAAHVEVVVIAGRKEGTSETSCTDRYRFVATHVECKDIAGVTHCDPK